MLELFKRNTSNSKAGKQKQSELALGTKHQATQPQQQEDLFADTADTRTHARTHARTCVWKQGKLQTAWGLWRIKRTACPRLLRRAHRIPLLTPTAAGKCPVNQTAGGRERDSHRQAHTVTKKEFSARAENHSRLKASEPHVLGGDGHKPGMRRWTLQSTH